MSYWNEKPREGMTRDEKAEHGRAEEREAMERERLRLVLGRGGPYGDRRPLLIEGILRSLEKVAELVKSNNVDGAKKEWADTAHLVEVLRQGDISFSGNKVAKKRKGPAPRPMPPKSMERPALDVSTDDDDEDGPDIIRQTSSTPVQSRKLAPTRVETLDFGTLAGRSCRVIVSQMTSTVQYRGQVVTRIQPMGLITIEAIVRLGKNFLKNSPNSESFHDKGPDVWERVDPQIRASDAWEKAMETARLVTFAL